MRFHGRLALAVPAILVSGLLVYAQSQARTASVDQTVAGTPFATLPGFVVERLNPANKTDSYVILTFDADGQPVVAREFDVPLRLRDRDGDGIYETEEVITDKLNTCQGLWFDGPTMYANCHATVSAEEAATLSAEVANAIATQSPVRGSSITVGPARAGGPGPAAGRGGAAANPARAGGGRGGRTNGPAAFFKVTPGVNGGPATVERVAQLAGTVQDHGPHAIRRGPDGSVMVFSGNNGGTPLNQSLDPDSLILGDKEAQLFPRLNGQGNGSQREGVHSALYRVDVAKRQYTVVTGGNRNTYDFAYNLIGEAFWYDSDNEPEIGVPWYREVRTVHGIPGGNYGYRDTTGKYPPWYIDSLPPMRDLDRGSPVGVETYQAYAYPREFFDTLLEADWSRGRLLYTTLTPRGATYVALEGAPEFLHGQPLNITDLEVGPDGNIYFTTGGRSTSGGFWRIRYTAGKPAQPDMTGILAVVRQPQPLSAWAWAAIESKKAAMGPSFGAELERLARNAAADPLDRARALYEMHRHGSTPTDALLRTLVSDRAQAVRAAAVYVAGLHSGSTDAATIASGALKDADALVRRRGLEAIVRLGQLPSRSVVGGATIYPLINDPDRFVRWSARIALERTNRAEWANRVLAETNLTGVMEGVLAWVRTAGTAPLTPIIDKQFALMKNPALTADQQLRLTRTFHYTMTELPGGLDPAQREQLFGLWAPRFPARGVANCERAASEISCEDRLNREIARTLAYSQQPGAIAEILAAMPAGADNPTLTLDLLYALRTITSGWTTAQKMQVVDLFATTRTWRGGMGLALGPTWDEFMNLFTDEEKLMAYQRAPAYAPVAPPPGTAPAAPVNPATPLGRRGGVLASKQERFDDLLYRADSISGSFGGRGMAMTPDSGRGVFEQECASCHRAGAVGQNVNAPDLTANRLNRRDILEAIFWPERKVDPAYKPMPDLFDRLSQEQVNALVMFLTSPGAGR